MRAEALDAPVCRGWHPPFARPRSDCGRGGTGRRAWFRSKYRKMWGFESLRPHQAPAPRAVINLRKDVKTSSMQITETTNEGLKRAYRITIPAGEIDDKIKAEVKGMTKVVPVECDLQSFDSVRAAAKESAAAKARRRKKTRVSLVTF